MRVSALLMFYAVVLIACAPFPVLDAAGPVDATPPELVPLDDILAQAKAPGTNPGTALAARAAALKARTSAP